MKNILYILFFIVVSYKTTAQITSIPDQNFEQELIDLGIDSDGIINGQVLTSDVEGITELIFSENFINDLTGIQDFASLEVLYLNHNLNLSSIDVSNNLNLRVLNISQNQITEIDLSNNILLEELYCGNPTDDVFPQNEITYIDLSNNPNIHTVFAENMFSLLNGNINLMNGNNQTQMYINVLRSGMDWVDNTPICIQVDNAENAINGNAPYSEWNVIGGYHFSGENCSLSRNELTKYKIQLYPNPVSEMLYFDLESNISVQKVQFFDFLGRKVVEQNNITDNVSVSDLQKGSYIIKIFSDNGIQTEKILVQN